MSIRVACMDSGNNDPLSQKEPVFRDSADSAANQRQFCVVLASLEADADTFVNNVAPYVIPWFTDLCAVAMIGFFYFILTILQHDTRQSYRWSGSIV